MQKYLVKIRLYAIDGFAPMHDTIRGHLRVTLGKNLLIDLEDRVRAEAVKAFEMIRDHSGLDRKRAREAEGQARFRMWEQGFEEVCLSHGGRLLDGGAIPNTELKVFQPFVRFEQNEAGIILGLAAMPEPKSIPTKNKSRNAGVSLNYDLSPRLDLEGKGPKVGDVFALMLVSRHRERAGQIEEIAVGVIDSSYESYLFYEPLDTFLSGHGDAPSVDPLNPTSPSAALVKVSLKKNVKPFVPPEAPTPIQEDGSTKDA
jgi:hypothetical protein